MNRFHGGGLSVDGIDANLLIRTLFELTAQMSVDVIHASGARPDLKHIMDEVFMTFAEQFHEIGLPRSVAADMFGLVVRSYLKRIQNYEENRGEVSQPLWKRILLLIAEEPNIDLETLLSRFPVGYVKSVKTSLNDLCDQGVLVETRRRKVVRYTIGLDTQVEEDKYEQVKQFVWLLIFNAKQPLTHEKISQTLHPVYSGELIEQCLGDLIAEGRVAQNQSTTPSSYVNNGQETPPPFGWESAVYMHLHAVFNALMLKLNMMIHDDAPNVPGHYIGGSTWTFRLWEGHPMEDEVLNTLSQQREAMQVLFERSKTHEEPEDQEQIYQCDLYVGQGLKHVTRRWPMQE